MFSFAILGFGNLARGVIAAASQNPDAHLAAVFTRRQPTSININLDVPVLNIDELPNWKDKFDVLVLCGGSAKDLPSQSPTYAKLFNIVDSFDTHANIPSHFKNVNDAAVSSNHLAIISTGWDPGLFSLARLFAAATLPNGSTYTFWGKGVSQGHSDAIRRINGVKDARQYTIPVNDALESVRSGNTPTLSPRQMHSRDCYVVLEDGADSADVERQIKNMPNYFADYDTTVHFISQEELDRDHSALPHGGFVIRAAKTQNNNHVFEFSLKLDSNPEFTGSVLLAYARAVSRLSKEGHKGCLTVFDIPPAYLSPLSSEELRSRLL